MNNLAGYMLESVRNFRNAVGFGDQSNQVHESLYASESIELLTATQWHEQADAYADMAVVMAGHKIAGTPFYDFHDAINGLKGMAISDGINLLEAFKIVMISNMSKVCFDVDRRRTYFKYSKEGVKINWVERDNGLWACYSADDYPDKPKGKLLKPVTYKEPDWSRDGWKL